MCMILACSLDYFLFILHFIFAVDIQEMGVAEKNEDKDIEEFVLDEGDCGEILDILLSNITNVSKFIDDNIIPDSHRDMVYTEDD